MIKEFILIVIFLWSMNIYTNTFAQTNRSINRSVNHSINRSINRSIIETCPTLSEVKHQLPKGWSLFDSDDGTPLSQERTQRFKNAVQQFVLAEWSQDPHNQDSGSIHCYYRDQNGSNFEAYVAKSSYVLINPKKVWYHVTGFMHCTAGPDKCLFESYRNKITLRHRQFAKR